MKQLITSFLLYFGIVNLRPSTLEASTSCPRHSTLGQNMDQPVDAKEGKRWACWPVLDLRRLYIDSKHNLLVDVRRPYSSWLQTWDQLCIVSPLRYSWWCFTITVNTTPMHNYIVYIIYRTLHGSSKTYFMFS